MHVDFVEAVVHSAVMAECGIRLSSTCWYGSPRTEDARSGCLSTRPTSVATDSRNVACINVMRLLIDMDTTNYAPELLPICCSSPVMRKPSFIKYKSTGTLLRNMQQYIHCPICVACRQLGYAWAIH